MSDFPAIEIKGLTFSYGGPPIFEKVNLTVEQRSFVSIIGPNGGGKTTLLRIIMGLLPAAAGEIRVMGLSPREARRQIGYMPQNAQFDPHFPISAMDVAMMGCLGGRAFPMPASRHDREVAENALEEVGLYEERHRPFARLSGGQRQRVLIARALACEPKILLLDEPTANLDQMVGNKLYDLLSHLNKRLTIIIVSHDVGFVSRFVESCVCVNRGLVVHPTCDLSNEAIAEMYGSEMKMVRHDKH